MFFLFVLFCTLMFNGAKLRIKNEKTTIIKEKISICSRINKKVSELIDFLIKLFLLPYLRKLSIYIIRYRDGKRDGKEQKVIKNNRNCNFYRQKVCRLKEKV